MGKIKIRGRKIIKNITIKRIIETIKLRILRIKKE
jgi:hypothetical protein